MMKFKNDHFVQARRVAEQWRKDGYNHLVVVREGSRARRCYPCRQQDVPARAVGNWDYYPIPTLDRLKERPPAEASASRAELWIAATIVYGCRYTAAPVH
jgi:hypothetical protein